MQWKRLVGSPWTMAVSTTFGVPGVLDDFDFWQRTVGDMSAGWQGALIGGGGAVLAISMLVFVEHRWAAIRAHKETLSILAIVALVAALLAGAGYGIWYGFSLIDFSGSDKEWVHPRGEDAAKALSGCEMRAYEVIGPGSLRIGDRMDYTALCMEERGFQLRVVDDG